MIACDENALICDFAETYHIYQWRALPARLAATLGMGLKDSSRIMMRLSGISAPMDTMLIALIADAARILVWQKTKDAEKGKNRPQSIYERLFCKEKTNENSTESFETKEGFLNWRSGMMREQHG